jgi:hypothetical protein
MADETIVHVFGGNMSIGSTKVKWPIAAGDGTSCGQEKTPVDAGAN